MQIIFEIYMGSKNYQTNNKASKSQMIIGGETFVGVVAI